MGGLLEVTLVREAPQLVGGGGIWSLFGRRPFFGPTDLSELLIRQLSKGGSGHCLGGTGHRPVNQCQRLFQPKNIPRQREIYVNIVKSLHLK